MNTKLKKAAEISIGPLLCAAALLTVFAIRGIWPFGSGNVTYYDMGQAVLPYYYHIYDWLHGLDSLTWDWFSGLGVSVAASGLPTPLDLVILLFKRNELINAMGVLFILRVCVSCVTAHISLGKMFKNVSPIWLTVFSMTYAMSAYSLFYYTNIFWLDFVILFPLLVLGFKKLADEGKILLYTIIYALMLCVSYYQGFMVTLAVIFVGGFYILFMTNRESMGRKALLLALSTGTGLLISCRRFLPSTIPALTSSRLEREVTKEDGMLMAILKTAKFSGFASKMTLLIGTSLLIVLTLTLLIKLLLDRKFKTIIFVLASLASLLLQIPLENTNLIWHGGSYVDFPMRFFFITIFILTVFACGCIDRYGEGLGAAKSKALRITEFAGMIFSCAFFIIVMVKTAMHYADSFGGTQKAAKSIIILSILSIGVGCAAYYFVLCGKKSVAALMCLALTFTQAVTTGCATVKNKFYAEEQRPKYNSESFIDYCNEAEELALESGPLVRTLNCDTSLNTNYPWLLRTYSISNWTHVIPSSLQNSLCALGYSKQYTRLLDSGGTAFTQSLLNIRQAVVRSSYDMPGNYTLKDKTENFCLYENNSPLDIGLTAGDDIKLDISKTATEDSFELQNTIYRMFGGQGDLIKICTPETDKADNIDCTDCSDTSCTFRYKAGQNEVLYLKETGFKFNGDTTKVHVNGKLLNSPYYKHTRYDYYPSKSVNGIVSLGSFDEGEIVEIKINAVGGTTLNGKNILLGSMCLDDIKALSEKQECTVTDLKIGKTSLGFNADNKSDGEKYVFIPVSYSQGFSCKINGEKAEVIKALGAFIAVKLPSGKSEVKLSYTTPLKLEGTILSLAGILLLIGLLLLIKKGVRLPKFIYGLALFALCAVVAAGVIGVYVIPGIFVVKYYLF